MPQDLNDIYLYGCVIVKSEQSFYNLECMLLKYRNNCLFEITFQILLFYMFVYFTGSDNYGELEI